MDKQLIDYQNKSTISNVLEHCFFPIYTTTTMLGVVFIFYFGSRNVTGDGFTYWDIAAFSTFLACFSKVAIKASKSAKLFNSVQKAKVSWDRIKPFMEKKVNDKKKIESPTISKLEFKDVSLAYKDGENKIKDLSFKLNKGEFMGVCGIIATGKSLLGKVFIDEAKVNGTILYDDLNFLQIPHDKKLSYVSYMGHKKEVLSTSIKENISLGDNIDINKYLKAVCLYDEVMSLPDKENTLVGPSGASLSGGQKERLVLARTLAHSKNIIVLDDPFSSLDSKTENEIFSNIQELYKDKIVILISHRLLNFPKLNHVLFIEDGISYFSTHEELLKNENYSSLYTSQIQGGKENE